MKAQSLLISAVLAFIPNLAYAINDIDPTDPSEPDPGPGGPGGPVTPPPPQPTFVKALNASNCFPNCSADWGAGYSVSGRLAATPHDATVPKDKLEGSGELDAFAKMNGSRYSLFKVRVTGVSEAKTRTDVSLTAYVAGAAVFTQPFVSLAGTYTPLSLGQSWQKTFFDKSVTVGVGPIPVTFRARATGDLGASLTGKISNVGFELAAIPSGKASLFASAAVGGQWCIDYVGCVGASAGIRVGVTLLEASAPLNYQIWWSLVNRGYGAQLNYSLTSRLTLKTLDGWLKVFASACLIACADWDRTLIEFTGWSTTGTLMDITGKYCIAGDCGTTLGMSL